MRMARVNVYLPDDLAAQAKQARLNVSAITQDAIRTNLAASATDIWLAGLTALDRTGSDTRVVTTDQALARAAPDRTRLVAPAEAAEAQPTDRSTPSARHPQITTG